MDISELLNILARLLNEIVVLFPAKYNPLLKIRQLTVKTKDLYP